MCMHMLNRGVGWEWAMGLRSPMAVTLWGRVWVCAGCGFVGIWRGGRGVDGAMWDFWVGWVWVYDMVATWRLGVPWVCMDGISGVEVCLGERAP